MDELLLAIEEFAEIGWVELMGGNEIKLSAESIPALREKYEMMCEELWKLDGELRLDENGEHQIK